MLASHDNILGFLTLAIGALGGISLLVGGVGILTIMITALNERRAEIGLLCALGARRRQILGLFLAEAVLLALAGGLLGVGLVVGLILLLGVIAPGIPLALDAGYLLLALGLSMLVGLLAGIVPALHAARLDPVASLHAE
jgi:putative ABC transport system permease protein